MEGSLIGRRIQVIIEEDGTPEPPVLPPATIMRRLAGPDADDYFLIKLDSSVECLRASTGTKWILQFLVVAARSVGISLNEVFDKNYSYVVVSIANLILPLDATATRFDFTQTEYFALGRVVRSE